MSKIKRLLAAFCGLALIVNATAMSAVGTHEIELKSGSFADESVTTFVLNVSGLAESADSTEDNFTANGLVMVKFPKGVFSDAALYDLGEDGLHYLDTRGRAKAPTLNDPCFNNTSSDEFDFVNIGWVSGSALHTPNGDIAEVELTYAGDPVEVEMSILYSVDVGGLEPQTSAISMSDSDNNVTQRNISYAINTNTYVLGTDGVVTKKETATATPEVTEVPATEVPATEIPATEAPATEAPTATPVPEQIPSASAPGVVNGTIFGGYTGDEDANDISAAVAAGLMSDGINAANSVLWTVTADGVTKTYTQEIATIEGEARVKVGLVIFGLAQSAIETVTAVLQ